MSGSDDYPNVRSTREELDDASIEALLHGDQTPGELDALATAMSAIRASGQVPIQPSQELRERMARGDFSDIPPYRPSMIGRAMQRFARSTTRAKAACLVAVGITGLSGVTAAGALPDAAQERVETAVEAVTPIEFPDRTSFGQEVAEDAQDEGVDGEKISEKAKDQGAGRGATHAPTEPSRPAETPPGTLPEVVPTDPPHDAPRSTPTNNPPADPPRDDAADDRPAPSAPPSAPVPDDPQQNDNPRDNNPQTSQ